MAEPLDPDIRRRVRFLVAPQFEALTALAQIAGKPSPALAGWAERLGTELPDRFWQAHRQLAITPAHWYGLCDWPIFWSLEPDFAATIARIEALAPEAFAQGVLGALLLDPRAVKALLNGHSLADAVALLPKLDRDWLTFLGFYPAPRPGGSFLEIVATKPRLAQRCFAICLSSFWHHFKTYWRRLGPRLSLSAEMGAARVRYLPVEEISWRFGVTLNFDPVEKHLDSIRSGYVFKFKTLAEIVMLPSLFNFEQIWSIDRSNPDRLVLYIPYLDPEMTVEDLSFTAAGEIRPPGDPVVVFRALGEATRFAMATLIARQPIGAADIARELRLSKQTVTHHLQQLRQAGLIEDLTQGSAKIFALRRSAIASLSARTAERLFEDRRRPPARPRRRKSA
jgi:ArsR family transcriptional regulator, arsenate/arsenite/antimonite-responsive transcriptional repressor